MVEDGLKSLSFFTGSTADAIWHHLFHIDPEERLEVREKQKMQLARYAKQSLLQWDNVETNELRRWMQRLEELLQAESEYRNATED